MSRVSQKRDHSVPVFTQRHYEYLQRIFPQLEITPKNTQEEIMYNAGEQRVLQIVKQAIGKANRQEIPTGPEE